jgi:hypothetical protein
MSSQRAAQNIDQSSDQTTRHADRTMQNDLGKDSNSLGQTDLERNSNTNQVDENRKNNTFDKPNTIGQNKK